MSENSEEEKVIHIVEEEIGKLYEEAVELNVATENVVIVKRDEFKQSY